MPVLNVEAGGTDFAISEIKQQKEAENDRKILGRDELAGTSRRGVPRLEEEGNRLDEGGDGGNQTPDSRGSDRENDLQDEREGVASGAADLASGQSSGIGRQNESGQYSGFAFEDDKADGGEGVRRDGDAAGEGVGSDGLDRPGRLDSRGESYGAVQASGARDGDERSYSEIVAGIESQAAVSPFERAEKNIDALKVRRELRIESGENVTFWQPSAGQLQILSQYSGWGGAAEAFSDDPEWAGIRSRLLDLLSDEEFAQARSSEKSKMVGLRRSRCRRLREYLESLPQHKMPVSVWLPNARGWSRGCPFREAVLKRKRERRRRKVFDMAENEWNLPKRQSDSVRVRSLRTHKPRHEKSAESRTWSL
ncbi:MAG: hypothetical protein U0L31_02440 [Bifidobacteriaceae bacterium]|nr:hypothetical protein [Bifidobacteriaceae bacterium]